MRRYIVFVFVFFVSTSVLSQNRNFQIPTYSDGDTTLWYKWKMELGKEIGLEDIRKTSNIWHFRLWTNKQVIEIWQNKDGVNLGKITNWVKEVTPDDEEPTHRKFYKSTELDSIMVNQLSYLIKNSGIKSIPDEMYIENWRAIDDGITYTTEIADENDYYFKTYGNPKSQDIVEAQKVRNFVDSVVLITNLKEIWIEFRNDVPFESYSYGGICTRVIGTRKQKRQFKKERKNYRKQHL